MFLFRIRNKDINSKKILYKLNNYRNFSTNTKYDVVIVGGGPGGYVSAIKAGQLGQKTACIDKRGALGGTCQNIGCIPSKTLLTGAHLLEEAHKKFATYGLQGGDKVVCDIEQQMKYKSTVVSGQTKGIEGQFRKNKVDYLTGHGKLIDKNTIEVEQNNGDKKKIETNNIVLATGSVSSVLPGIEVDEKIVCTSTGALSLQKIPKHLIVIGAGVIGQELGTVYRSQGSKVTVIEYIDRITPGMDYEQSKTFQKILEKQGIEFHLSTRVDKVINDGKKAIVKVTGQKNSLEKEYISDIVLVATGRRPYHENLGLENLGIEITKRGTIVVDDKYRTIKYSNIYGIGDIIDGPMLAHKAEEEGVAVAEIIHSGHGHVNYNAIPSVIYTFPEFASVGKTEEEIKKLGIEYKVGKFPFLANSRARSSGESDGMVKIITDAKTDHILGAHILGPNAGELISELVLGIEYGASAEDIARTSHAHPTLSEAMKEACHAAAFGKPINM